MASLALSSRMRDGHLLLVRPDESILLHLERKSRLMNTNHPIDREILSRTLNKHIAEVENDSSLGFDSSFSEEQRQVDRDLENVQQTLESNLKYIMGCTITGNDDVYLLWQSPNYFIFDDQEQIFLEGLRESAKTDYDISFIQEFHSRMAHEVFRTFTEKPQEKGDRWIIKVPQDWYHATQSVETLLTELIKKGLSPTQALDYWMVEIQDKSVSNWAMQRDTSTQAIRQSVERATERINQESNIFEYDPDHYFKSVYDGQYTPENQRIVTANGHHLHPRNDLFDYSSSGSLNWGYNGAGPTQLAAAILCDAGDPSQVDHDMVVSFRSFCNTKTKDRDRWRIVEDDISEWHTEYKSTDPQE